MNISCDLRRIAFQAAKVGLLFGQFPAHTTEDIVRFAPNCFSSRQSRPTLWPVSLGPPLAKSQKMGDLGVFAKFVITRLCRHFWSRRLRRKVVR